MHRPDSLGRVDRSGAIRNALFSADHRLSLYIVIVITDFFKYSIYCKSGYVSLVQIHGGVLWHLKPHSPA